MKEKLSSIFQSDRIYTVLFFVLVILYTGLLLFYPSSGSSEKPSQAIQQFREAENIWQEQMATKDAMEQYIREHPGDAMLFMLLSLGVIFVFGAGFMLDLAFVFNPKLRQRFLQRASSITLEWPLILFFKVVVLWIVISLGISLLFALLTRAGLMPLNFNAFAVLHTTVMDFLCVALILYVIKGHKGTWRDLGFSLTLRQTFKEIGAGLFGYIAVLPIFFLVLLVLIFLANLFNYEPAPHPLVGIFLEEEKSNPVLVMYSVILASVIGPFIEEIFFRGFCYPILKHKWGIKWAMLLSSLFFALIHQNQFAFLPIFILGLSLAWLYEKRSNLVAPIALHLIHNSFFLAYFFAAKKVILDAGIS